MVIYISRHVQWKADDCQEAWRHEVLILLQHFLHNAMGTVYAANFGVPTMSCTVQPEA